MVKYLCVEYKYFKIYNYIVEKSVEKWEKPDTGHNSLIVFLLSAPNPPCRGSETRRDMLWSDCSWRGLESSGVRYQELSELDAPCYFSELTLNSTWEEKEEVKEMVGGSRDILEDNCVAQGFPCQRQNNVSKDQKRAFWFLSHMTDEDRDTKGIRDRRVFFDHVEGRMQSLSDLKCWHLRNTKEKLGCPWTLTPNLRRSLIHLDSFQGVDLCNVAIINTCIPLIIRLSLCFQLLSKSS